MDNLRAPTLQIIVVSIGVALAFLIGLFIGQEYFSSGSISTQVAPTVEQVIIDPAESWGQVVTDTSIQFRLQGKVTNIKTGVLQGGQPRREFTLENGGDQAVIMVREQAETYEGTSFIDPNTWSQEKGIGIVSVGDTVIIRAQSPFNPAAKLENFYGWWVFKLLPS